MGRRRRRREPELFRLKSKRRKLKIGRGFKPISISGAIKKRVVDPRMKVLRERRKELERAEMQKRKIRIRREREFAKFMKKQRQKEARRRSAIEGVSVLPISRRF